MSIHIGIKIQNITMLKSLSFKYPIKDETDILGGINTSICT